jgi:hypothetical protein
MDAAYRLSDKSPMPCHSHKRREIGDGKPDVITTAVLICSLAHQYTILSPTGRWIYPAAFSFRGIRYPSVCLHRSRRDRLRVPHRPRARVGVIDAREAAGYRLAVFFHSFTRSARGPAQFVLRVALGWQRCIFAARQPTKRKRIGFEA